jgi:hypothetical protein
MYGWRSFEPEIVNGIYRRDPRALNEAGLVCPLVGHEHGPLPWRIYAKREKATEPHGSPAISFRASPTFIYEQPLDNFIVGHQMIRQALAGAWGKAETWRLGFENSEDALSWNVFRSLQESGHLRLAARLLGGVDTAEEPELYLWGRRIGLDTVGEWANLTKIRDELEPRPPNLARGRRHHQTEPDVVLHVGGWGWIFIEAKLASKTDTYKTDRVEEWIGRYSVPCPGVFNEVAIRGVESAQFPQQLLRNIAFAYRMRERAEQAVVVALVRESDKTEIASWVTQCLMSDVPVPFRRGTWEGFYRALPVDPSVKLLRDYLESKSVGLRPAFAIDAPTPGARASAGATLKPSAARHGASGQKRARRSS